MKRATGSEALSRVWSKSSEELTPKRDKVIAAGETPDTHRAESRTSHCGRAVPGCGVLRFRGLPSAHLPGPPQGAPGFRAGVLAVFQNLPSVYKNVLHADGVLMGFIKCRPIGDGSGVEHHHV